MRSILLLGKVSYLKQILGQNQTKPNNAYSQLTLKAQINPFSVKVKVIHSFNGQILLTLERDKDNHFVDLFFCLQY